MSGRRKKGAGQSGQLCRGKGGGRPRIAAESPAPRLRGARPEKNSERKAPAFSDTPKRPEGGLQFPNRGVIHLQRTDSIRTVHAGSDTSGGRPCAG